MTGNGLKQHMRKAALRLSAEDHADIFKQLLHLQDGQAILFAASDLHEDGVTSLFSEVKPVVEGAISLSNVVCFAGTDSEYESNEEVINTVVAMERDFKQQEKSTKKANKEKHEEALLEAIENILRKKADQDLAWRKKLMEDHPQATFLEVAANHSNVSIFRERMLDLASNSKRYTFGLELGAVRLGTNNDGDTVLVSHSHHQLDDGGIVADGFTDKQMGYLTLRQMAKKALEIARTQIAADTNLEWATRKLYSLTPELSPAALVSTVINFVQHPLLTSRTKFVCWVDKILTPSAELQEQWQALVTFFRKPVSTARKIHRELGYRAVLGSVMEQLNKKDGDVIDTGSIQEQLQQRIDKIDRKLKEMHDDDLGLSEHYMRERAYKEEKASLQQNLLTITKAAHGKSPNKEQPLSSWLEDNVLHVAVAGEKDPVVFTKEFFDKVNKVISGHTHVPSTGVWIDRNTAKQIGGEEDTASHGMEYINLGSATEKILTGECGRKAGGKPLDIKLENMGATFTVYDKETGKIDRVLSIGQLIEQNRARYDTLVAEKAGLKAEESSLAKKPLSAHTRNFEDFRARQEAVAYVGRGR